MRVWVLVSLDPGSPTVAVYSSRALAEAGAKEMERGACGVTAWREGWRDSTVDDDTWVRTAVDGCAYTLREHDVDE